jgi:hypothetical protein
MAPPTRYHGSTKASLISTVPGQWPPNKYGWRPYISTMSSPYGTTRWKEYGLLPWLRFAEFINLRFGPPIRSNHLGDLKELHRTGTVDDYQCQFLSMLYH